jgi:predicted phage-related endonuclease
MIEIIRAIEEQAEIVDSLYPMKELIRKTERRTRMGNRNEWLEERKGGIGGSDWDDVLGIEPYGCARRCWYSKSGVEADYPEEDKKVFKRGRILEPHVFDEFDELEQGPPLWRPDPEDPTADFEQTWGFAESICGKDIPDWWYGTPDAVMPPTETELPGIFEAKTVGPFAWMKVVREGIPERTIAQRQHYLGLSGMTHGVVGYLEPSSWEFAPYPYERDEELLSLMLSAGEVFWKKVTDGNIPDRLGAADHRCKDCRWYPTCWDSLVFTGDDTRPDADYTPSDDPKIVELYRERVRAKTDIKESEAQVEGIDAEIFRHLGGVEEAKMTKLQTEYGKLRISDGSYTRTDEKAFAAKYPRIAAAIKEKFRRTYQGQPSIYLYPKKGAKK